MHTALNVLAPVVLGKLMFGISEGICGLPRRTL